MFALESSLSNVSGVTLEWDPSPDAWVAGYAIHYGTTSSNYTVRLDLGNHTSATLTNLTPGTTYYFVATAYTSDGQESLPSNEVSYTVPESPPVDPTNQPPLVVAGENQLIALPAAALLAGTVSDDGRPSSPGTLITEWSVVSGTGHVTFESSTATFTTASFSNPGAYRIRLTASDGELSTTDDLTVTVVPDLPQYPFGLVIEAENGWLSDPMQVGTNANTGDADAATVYISTRSAEQGTSSCGLEVPEAGAYVLWARLFVPNGASTSFYVSCDAALADVLAGDITTHPVNAWQWIRLPARSRSGRFGIAAPSMAMPRPRVFMFEAGSHLITVTGGDAGVLLDKFIVTNDRSFVPSEGVTAPIPPVISGLRPDTGGIRLTWSSATGALYRLVYRDALTDSCWLPVSPNVVAVGATLSWLDQTGGASGQRYYAVLMVR